MTHVLVQPQHQATFASPPPNGTLPYPSYTPYPSRTATPSIAQALAQTASSSSSSNNTLPSAHSFGTSSLSRWKSWRSSNSSKSKNKYHNNIASSVGHTPRLPRRRSQTAPWKTPTTPSAPPPYRHGDTIININRDTDGSKMAYYGYYQQQAPNWATAQYEPIAPPMTYHPTPNWGGYDYYQAHSGDTDRSLFDSLWGRFKSAIGWTTQGYSRQHAKQIYRRVYGGVADLLDVPPEELGAAAGYEAIRLWEYQHNQYQMPLNPDLEREREALAGLSIAEANKLWDRANPYRSRRGRHITAEVAVATAERIFTFQYDKTGGVAPYLSPEQQMANRGILSNRGLIQSPYGPEPLAGPSTGYGPGPAIVPTGRRSRRGSWAYLEQPGPPLGGIPVGGMGGMGAGPGGMYQNAQGYTIASSPPIGVPYPQEIPPSPRSYGRPIVADPYGYDDEYVVPTGAPGSFGAPGSYGAPRSFGGGGGAAGYVPVGTSGTYGGYDEGLLPAPGYRRQRSRSFGYGGGY